DPGGGGGGPGPTLQHGTPPGGGRKVTPGGVFGGDNSSTAGGDSIATGISDSAGGAMTSTRLAGICSGISGIGRSANTLKCRCLVLVSTPATRAPGERPFIISMKLLARSAAAAAKSTPLKLATEKAVPSASVRTAPPAPRSRRRRRARTRRIDLAPAICLRFVLIP